MLLAAATAPRPGERVIEAGSGSGAAALCLASRFPGARVTGLEIEPDLVALANRNAGLNGLQDRAGFIAGCVTTRPPALGQGQFDHALANPPYLEAGSAMAPPDRARARAFVGREACLADWVSFCLDMVRLKGTVTFIHRADHLDTLIALLHGPAGEIALYPLWPKTGLPAKRILVHARKGVKGAAMMMPGLVLHEADGGYAPAAQAVLRYGAGIDLSRKGWERLMHKARH